MSAERETVRCEPVCTGSVEIAKTPTHQPTHPSRHTPDSIRGEPTHRSTHQGVPAAGAHRSNEVHLGACRIAKEHAAWLVRWLREDEADLAALKSIGAVDDYVAKDQRRLLLFEDIEAGYREMCLYLGWYPLRCNSVGQPFPRLTGGKKYTGPKGARVRCYIIPPLPENLPDHWLSTSTLTNRRAA